MKALKLQRAITFDLELCFEQTYSHWKSLGEQKTMVSFLKGFEEVQEKQKLKNLIPHPLKGYLGGWVSCWIMLSLMPMV
jgi:hypothetical protein